MIIICAATVPKKIHNADLILEILMPCVFCSQMVALHSWSTNFFVFVDFLSIQNGIILST